jgi:hypothetical protein
MVKVLVKMGRSFEPTLEESKVTHGSALELSLFKLQLEKHGHAVEFENSLDLPARTIRVLTRKSNGKSSRVVGESTHHLIKKSCEVDRIIDAIASTLVKRPMSARRRHRRTSRSVRAEKEPTEEVRTVFVSVFVCVFEKSQLLVATSIRRCEELIRFMSVLLEPKG